MIETTVEQGESLIPRRNMPLLRVAETLGRMYTLSFFNVEYRNEGVLQQVADRGFFLLANHQFFDDILLEYLLIKDELGKSCRTVMRDSLPGNFMLKYLGGLPMPRTKEYKKSFQKAKTQGEREKAIEKYESAKEALFEIEKELMYQKQVVVVHPEGTRKNIPRPLTIRRCLEHILKLQEELTLSIPCVALNIHYESGSALDPRAKVTMTVANPIEVEGQEGGKLVDYFMSYAMRTSSLPNTPV